MQVDTFTDKRRPIEERVAAMMGRSGYRDLRDGPARGGMAPISDQDIAAAIGSASRVLGRASTLALETYYGPTLVHQTVLLRAWEEAERKKGDTREQIVLTRFAGALAIQEMADSRVPNSAYTEYAYLIFSQRGKLELRVREARAWLEDLRSAALQEMKAQLFCEKFDGTRNTP